MNYLVECDGGFKVVSSDVVLKEIEVPQGADTATLDTMKNELIFWKDGKNIHGNEWDAPKYNFEDYMTDNIFGFKEVLWSAAT